MLNSIFIDDIPENVLQELKKELTDGSSSINDKILHFAGKVNEDPIFSKIASRLLAYKLKEDTYKYLGCNKTTYFRTFISYATKEGILTNNMLLDYDLDRLAKAIDVKRMSLFNYIGLKTLIDRYFIRDRNGIIIELPQTFFMRVAMGLAGGDTDKAIEFYELMSTFDYMPSTPTLFNSGTMNPQLSSCFVSTVSDSIDGIFTNLKNNAHISKWSGGIGVDWTDVRATNSHIKGTNGASQGVIPFMKIMNDMLVAVNQGGKRRGAGVAYLEIWHKDYLQFLQLRKNTGDDRLRTHDMNTASWIPDLFMERVKTDGDWTLFDPKDVCDLHELYGKHFDEKYTFLENDSSTKKVKMKARTLFRQMLIAVFETGHPWFVFKDAFNHRNPQNHVGVIRSSNLCTEVGLNTSENEIAVCNLGSINVDNFVESGKVKRDDLEKAVTTAVHMLNRVIDINYHVVKEAKIANHYNRPIGLGIMGYHTMLQKNGISFSSDRAIKLGAEIMELIQYFAMKASCDMAKKRYKGAYPTFSGSKWEKQLTHQTYHEAINARPKNDNFVWNHNVISDENYEVLLKDIKKYGMVNSTLTAIAPTATISNITGVSQSIEPIYSNLFTKSNLSGEFQVMNSTLITDLKDQNLFTPDIVRKIQENGGSIQSIDEIPSQLKELYKTAFEVDHKQLLKGAAARQKYIDQAQSLNIYIESQNGDVLGDIYMDAYEMGLKSTYYLRTKAATNISSTTSTIKACALDEGCESCQ